MKMLISKAKVLCVLGAILVLNMLQLQAQNPVINYIDQFENVNHPQVAYWFFDKSMLDSNVYKAKIDSIATFSKYTLVFLTARNGANFYNVPQMKPIFSSLVNYAHAKGLKIGLQLWEKREKTPLEHTERLIQENEIVLDKNGMGAVSVASKGARDVKLLLKQELLAVWAFKKVGEGVYAPNSLIDITQKTKTAINNNHLDIAIEAGTDLKGYTAYILTQHYYNYTSNHSVLASDNLTQILMDYASIPFDGVGLDEYTNLRVATSWELKKVNGIFRERPYSLAMADEYQKTFHSSVEKDLLTQRYVPIGHEADRAKAINRYMFMVREGTMHLEKLVYDKGKAIFGKNTFIGLHDTHHNDLEGDEVWQTGLNWWRVKRDYGHTDETTPTCTQMGVGMSNTKNVMYNMFYKKDIAVIAKKALTDLRYGIRTHYHAINDVQGWGVSVDKLDALKLINPVENAARLLNRFNPSFPDIKLLILFGIEKQVNWFPDTACRNANDINACLDIEKKAKEVWDAGYLNALMPADMIEDGKLTLNKNGKPTINGHVFDAVLFLYPECAHEKTIQFLTQYVAKGGKLMTEGQAHLDFEGHQIDDRWKEIASKAVATTFSLSNIEKLGVAKNSLDDGAKNEDGSYTFTNPDGLTTGKTANFSIAQNGKIFKGNYSALAAIKTDKIGRLEKLAATGMSELTYGDKTILKLGKPADVYFEWKQGRPIITVADKSKEIKVAYTE